MFALSTLYNNVWRRVERLFHPERPSTLRTSSTQPLATSGAPCRFRPTCSCATLSSGEPLQLLFFVSHQSNNGRHDGIGCDCRFLKAKLTSCQAQLEEVLQAHQASQQEAMELRRQVNMMVRVSATAGASACILLLCRRS